jgi:hypothetical protein
VGGPYTPLWWTPKEGYRKSDGPQAEPGDTLPSLVWPASAGSQEECAVLDALERYEKVCSASHAGKARKGYRGPVTKAITRVCLDLEQDTLEISPRVILDILRQDSLYGPEAEGARIKAGVAEPEKSMVAELFEAGLVDIRIQEVIDSLENENKTKIRYRARDGVADEFTFKTVRNLVSEFLNR